MPSTVVHVGLAGLLGIALLGDRFDTRAIVVVMAATALIDLDTLVGIYWQGAHRAVFHNVFVVLIPAIVLYWDVNWRETSFVRSRWGAYGYHVAWVTLVCVFVAHILLDAFYNGVALFWPLDTTFYDLSGEFYLSNHDGIVQTFVEISTNDGSPSVDDSSVRGTTADTHYYTGFDPGPDAEPDTERIFPIASSGELFVTALAGYLAVGYRVWDDLRSPGEDE
ncbi:metal-dependent hydrolase [Halovivax gelatinilyticus]|uniref:metal-dependent hydrolase n=1 Tax=Halovivax gelatinilyticus TaxID=2961597 RepID=UPI0020CA8A00|nr:metal-dependent hydrolase [Halovivax gelatinilyticus]